MGLTTTSLWDESRLNQRARRAIVLELTDGATTWYIGTQDMILTDGHVFQGLQAFSNITSGVSLYTKAWTVPTITVTISNYPVMRTEAADSFKRWSDLLTGLREETAKLYFFVGDRMTALSDGLLRFQGIVQADPEFNNKRLKIKITSDILQNNRLLPQNLVGNTYSGAPMSSYSRKIPLVYGEWRMDDGTNSPLGLAVAEQTDQNKEAIYVISDHALDSIEKSYTQIEELSPCLSELVDQDHDVNASGYGTSQLDRWYWTLRALTKLRPIDSYAGPYDAAVLDSNVTNIANALDGDPMSYASLLDYFDDNTTRKARAVFCWGDYSNEENSGETPMGLIIEHGGVEKYVLKIVTQREAGDMFQSKTVKAVYGQRAGTDDEKAIGDLTLSSVKSVSSHDIDYGSSTTPNLREGWAWHLRSGNKDYKTKDDRITAIGDRDFSDAANWANVDFNAFNKTNDLSVTATAIGQKCELAATGVNGFVSGDQYRITYDCVEIISGVEWAMGGQTVAVVNGTAQTAVFTATSNGTKLALQSTTNNAFIHIDNVSVVEEDDRTTEDWPYIIRLDLETSDEPDSEANGVTLDSTVAKIFDIYLEINHQFSWLGGRVFVACNGREYGSWIAGRSSGYAAGDAIEDPAGIIESLLRDELGFASAKIDMPSFIAAENTSVKARVNLHSGFEPKASDLIRMIAEQSTFMFVMNPVGQAKLIDLSDSSPTTDHKIPFSHVKNGDVTIRKTTIIRDTLVIESRFQGEYDGYRDTNADSPINDATASGMTYSAKWRFLAGSSVTTVGNLYVNSTNGLWSKEHIEVIFETVGFTWAHVLEGDWIELDATTWDPQLKASGGVSWSGKQLLVTKVEQSFNGTKLTMIELW